MKVAIIGAGISGLSCAVELKRHGITPIIFEKTKSLGDKPGNLVAILRIFYRYLRNPVSFIESEYGLQIRPLHPLNELVMITPNKTMSAKGKHGFVFEKGLAENSVEHQIASHANLQIEFDTHIKLEDIKNDFDHIVIATADNESAKDLGIWTTTFMAKIRLATVTGTFDTNTMKVWLNKRYANNGYGYLMPKSANEGELVLCVSDISQNKIDYFWNEFLTGENLKYPISKLNDIEHTLGFPSVNQLDNLYLTGNYGGLCDDFLGFGFLNAVESGILSARAIVHGLDYNELLKPFIKNVKALHEYRKVYTVLNNNDLDSNIQIIGFPGIKQLIYNNPLYKAKYGVPAAKIKTNSKKKYYMFEIK